MPAIRYRRYWRVICAFALPTFCGGRIRINLKGREVNGLAALKDYDTFRSPGEDVLKALHEPSTGGPAVESVGFTRKSPMRVSETQEDVFVRWRPGIQALVHRQRGAIGPVPHFRTGGHTEGHGMACITKAGEPGFRGVKGAYDAVPTIFHLPGVSPPPVISGQSLLPGAP